MTAIGRMTQEELTVIGNRSSELFKTPEFEEQLYNEVKGKGMVVGPRLMEVMDEVHIKHMNEWGYNGRDALTQLQHCVKVYPNIQPVIVEVCNSTETVLQKVTQKIAADNGVEIPTPAKLQAAQKQMTPQHMMLMQMAFKNLTETQRSDMMRIQQAASQGQMPSVEDQEKMKVIQQSIMQYAATMGPILQQMQQPAVAAPKK